MRDYHSSCVRAGSNPPLLYISQFLRDQRSGSGDVAPDGELLRSEPRERRSALVVDDVADVTEMLAVVLTHAGY
jgi:hypothetical protein